MHNIRATDSYIRGSNGTSNGIVPMLRVFNDTARYVDQGGGKRKGSFAMYLEPWHADIGEVSPTESHRPTTTARRARAVGARRPCKGGESKARPRRGGGDKHDE